MNHKIKDINETMTHQGIQIIFHILIATAVMSFGALAYFFFTSPMPKADKIYISTIPALVILAYIISLLTIQMKVDNLKLKAYLFVGVCYAFYLFMIVFYFSLDTIPLVILLSVLFVFMTQILMQPMVAYLFAITGLLSATAMLIFRSGQIFDIGIGIYMTIVMIILSALYGAIRYIDLLKQYTDRIKRQVHEIFDSEERNQLLHKASRELIWDLDLGSGKRNFPQLEINEFGDHLSASPYIEDWMQDIHPDDVPELLRLYQEVASGMRDYFEIEFRHLNGKGEPVWYSAKSISLKNDEGIVEKMAGSYIWIHDRKTKELEIEHLAFYDEDTGLPNRAAFFRDMLAFRENTGADGQCFLEYLDILNFREINSTFGHSIGDQLVKNVAERLGRLDANFKIYKLTSTDFGIWAEGGEAESVEVARAVLETFDRHFLIEGKELFVNASLGISLYPNDAADAPSLFRNADTALYYCRKDESIKYLIYSPEMTNNVYNKMNMLNLMHQAIERQEFYMNYQPLIRVSEDKVTLYGFEALIRWKSPQLGLVPPDQFIPLAEESGLIQSIGSWVLEESCGFIKTLSAVHPSIVVSVNISAKQLASENFIAMLMDVVKKTGVQTNNLCLEITETSFIESFADVQPKLQYIKAQGILLALDDFGTGYSSLNYLGQLNIDTLKIDKSFTAKVINGNSDFYLIKSIIALATDLKLSFVAEGIETAEQLALLKSIGCPIVQGYYFAKAMSQEDALKYNPQNE